MSKLTQEQLRTLALQDMKEGISKVINGEERVFKSKVVHMGDVAEYLERIGEGSKSDFDSNGWQGDMWESFGVDDKIVEVFAEGYYGGVTVSLGEKEEDED